MDIDLDFKTSFDPLVIFPHVIRASMVNNGELVRHPCGVYFQTMPTDQQTGLAAIPYKTAENLGFTKIDCLHLSALDSFTSRDQLLHLANRDPEWELFLQSSVTDRLFQLGNAHAVLERIKPTSVEQVADCIAIIRPGKRQFLDQYVRDPIQVRPLLYRATGDTKSAFRRGHALAYALTAIAQLNDLVDRGLVGVTR